MTTDAIDYAGDQNRRKPSPQKRLTLGFLAVLVIILGATPAAFAVNSITTLLQDLPDTLCPGQTVNVCAKLEQKCGGNVYAPLEGRLISFYLNSGNCGVDVGHTADDSAYTDSNGVACVSLTVPTTPGGYSLRADFIGEDKPGPGDPPNSACDTTERVQLSNSNDCETFVVDSSVCSVPPTVACPGDLTVKLCSLAEVCIDGFDCFDVDGDLDSCWVSFGSLSGDTVCFTPTSEGTYTIILSAVDSAMNMASCTTDVTVVLHQPPVVNLPSDTSLFLCDPIEFCVPVDITDVDCDIVSVTTSPSPYGGNDSGFDQVAKLTALGGTVTQVGGGAPGTLLSSAADFVPPVNSQSGVSVSLPDFTFADYVVDYGSFPSGLTPANSADHLLGSPTDMTFTAAGIGGPDGGDGDGSVAFASGNYAILGLNSPVTTCNGAAVDFFVFSNTGAGGTAQFDFRLNGTVVHSISHAVPGATSGSGQGGVTLDLPDGIEFDEVRIQSVGGTLEIDAIAVRTAGSAGTQDLCFTADTTGLYEVIVTATDSCGFTGGDTMYVNVTLNSAPVVNAGADFSRFLCDLEEICFGVSITDVDANIVSTQIVSGPGTLSAGQLCFTPTGDGVYTFIIEATDECGESDRDTVNVTVATNLPPVAVVPDTQTVFQCAPATICYTFTATDPENGTLTWTHLAGVGSISTVGEFCFTPTFSGIYEADVVVSDSCGASDTVRITYIVTINSAPVAVDPGAAVDLTLCESQEVCYQFDANDVDNEPLTWTMVSGDGTLSSSGLWCFTPTTTASFSITAVVSDSCGAADTVSHTYNVTVNEPPTVVLSGDTALSLCDPQEICVSYTVADPNGLDGIVETMVSGFGTIDTAANEICFTPTVDGLYEFIVQVADSCGEISVDTANVLVDFGEEAVISCPVDPIAVSLCSPDQVCRLLTISPSTATVTTSFGTYSGGQLCFQADTSGTYVIEVIADAACGADTCQLTFNVDIGSAAQITCPPAQSIYLCEADNVCIPVGINGTDLTISVSPIGSYSAGNVCFPADTTGHYELTVIADTPCGSDTCQIIADITINSSPVADVPTSPIDTFLCDPAQICYQFTATDADGNPLTWMRLSGNGTVSSDGLWCFNAGAAGSYTVTAVVADSCNAADTVTLTYNVAINSAPVLAFGNDTTQFRCVTGPVCVDYSLTDADDNIALEELLSGPAGASLDSLNDRVCFNVTSSGSYEFIVRATDECGEVDTDTIVLTFVINTAPVVDLGPDQNLFDCEPGQICIPGSVSDAEANIASVTLTEGPGTWDGSQICFTPAASGIYQFVLEAVDDCGAVGADTVVVVYAVNNPPSADAGADQSLFQCAPTQVCWSVSCDDVDGNLASCALIEGPGTYNGSQICFTPASSGSYLFVLQATDDCGETALDSVVIDVSINEAPVCIVPNDTLLTQCTPQEVCLPVSATDADGNFELCRILSGPGSLSGGNWCYTPAADHSVTVVVECQDSCGAVCQTEFTVEFDVNTAPQIAFGADVDTFLCESGEVCLPYTASDADGIGTTTITLVSGPGTLDVLNSQVCFTPTESSSETFVVRIEDECGAFDEDTINVTVDINSPPVANAGADQTIFLCDPGTEICWAAGCSDIDGNLLDCNLIGPGTYDGSGICFTPTTSGDYQFILEATDDCGILVADTAVITIINNDAPTVSLPGDFSELLCVPTQICFNYTASDPDGTVLTETMVSGYGTIDTAANEICFTPTTAGQYEFIVRVADSCGVDALDTLVVTVDFGAQAEITCPSGPIDVSLCSADLVCYQLDIEPQDATITTSLGTYANGELCFQADTSGTYVATVVAETACGADTCSITFNVDINSAAQIVCPEPQSIFLCEPDTACVPITVVMKTDTVIVSPIGYYSAGNLCFPADTSGHYELTVIASTSCGADTCVVIADVAINTAPVADDPTSPVDSFFCETAQYCYTFTATDADNDDLTWSRIDGPGSIDPATGEWCFTPSGTGSYTVTVVVSDPCGAADTTTLTVNVELNSPPVVDLGGNKLHVLTRFFCNPLDTCLSYTTSDPDNNIVSEELIAGFGTLDTVSNEICFTADTAGLYVFVMQVTDACGETDLDTLNLTVELNAPPTADAGADQSVFLCDIASLCWPASCSDPDNNLDSCYVTSPVGAYASGEICFTPDTAGVYEIVLRSVDACGASDEDTVFVTVSLNSPPVCQVPGDTTIVQCTAAQVSLPLGATDVDGNFSHCEIESGPGSINNGQWVYTPTGDQAATVSVVCIDDCGATCRETFTVTFDVNDNPVVDLGGDTTVFLCESQTVCRTVSIADDDNNIESIEILSPAGATLNGDQLCFTVTEGVTTYSLEVRVTDSCGAATNGTATVTASFNRPPTLSIPPEFVVYLDNPDSVCFMIDADDPDDNLTDVSVSSPAGIASGSEYACFQADTSGVYCFEVIATDACGETAVDSICVTVQIDECFHVQIEKTHGTFQGSHEQVDVFLQSSGKELGGYDLLIQYDPSALYFNNATPGELLEECGWEYFTFRQGADGNCSGCPTGLVRIVAIAETNNGANHPGCFLATGGGSLATLDFLVTNDRTLECQYVPIRFYWIDCGDNSFSSVLGDTLWVSRHVYDLEMNEITNDNYNLPGYFGAPNECLIPDVNAKGVPIRCVDFTNGGIDIVCADSIDDRGDLNLNGQAYEISDAVLYTNIFVYGIDVAPDPHEAVVAASDVNADGIPLSVGDLVYLIRVIVGDASPLPKLNPEAVSDVQMSFTDGLLSIEETEYRIGALYVTVEGRITPELPPDANDMEIQYSFDGTDTRILVYDLSGSAYLQTGEVLTLNGATKVKEVQLGSFEGLSLAARLNTLPTDYELHQNYPNPFNPSTTIEFALPKAGEWDIKVYNVLGRQVTEFSGENDPGWIKIEWDASDHASGVYFYRLRAGNFSATKKMVLLK